REDVLLCPCGGRRVVRAFVTEKKIVKEILEYLGLQTTGPPVAAARIAAASEVAPGRTTYRSCSKRCADGGGQLCAYALISPCAPGCSAPPPRLVAEDGMREEGRGDRTALIRPLALSSVG